MFIRRSAQRIWARSRGEVVCRIPGRVRPGSATGDRQVSRSAICDSAGAMPSRSLPCRRAEVTIELCGSTHSTLAYRVICSAIGRSVPMTPFHAVGAIHTR